MKLSIIMLFNDSDASTKNMFASNDRMMWQIDTTVV
jgi:hypothetical protein